MDNNETAVQFRPWHTIWRHPRETVQQALTDLSTDQFYTIIGLFSIVSVLGQWDSSDIQSVDSVIFGVVGSIVAVAITMLLMGEALPRLINWTGRIFDAYKPLPDIKSAFAVTLIPFIPFILLDLIIDWVDHFAGSSGANDISGASWFTLGGSVGLALPMMLVGLGILVWLMSIACRGMSELFGYSAWKAFIHLMVSWVLFTLAAIAVALPLVMLFG